MLDLLGISLITAVLSTTVGAIAGLLTAKGYELYLIRRLDNCEGLLKAWFARNARRERKEASEAGFLRPKEETTPPDVWKRAGLDGPLDIPFERP